MELNDNHRVALGRKNYLFVHDSVAGETHRERRIN
jgi:hypothetical protein